MKYGSNTHIFTGGFHFIQDCSQCPGELQLGFTPIALTNDYALFTHPQHHYSLSFRLDASAPEQSTTGLKLLFMTRNIPAADAHLEQTGLIPSRAISKGSPVQDVISFATPNGVAVEIWEDPTPVEGD